MNEGARFRAAFFLFGARRLFRPARRSSPAHSTKPRISSLTVEARPTHALAYEAAHDASMSGHALIGDMDAECVALIALRIESAARPTRGAGWADI